MIRAIALDDEPLALEVIRNYCDRMNNISLEKVFNKPNEALKHLNKYQVDLIFLDIEIPAFNGIDFYQSLKQDTKVIFTTAYREYAVKAFELAAIDYLVKPFPFERFEAAVQKVEQLSKTVESHYVFVRANYKLHKVAFEDILFIESINDYVKLHLMNQGSIVVRESLKNMLNKMPPSRFVRIHRSYIVSIGKIKAIQNGNVIIQDFILPIGETYKDELIKFF